jgi:hypothetical protein
MGKITNEKWDELIGIVTEIESKSSPQKETEEFRNKIREAFSLLYDNDKEAYDGMGDMICRILNYLVFPLDVSVEALAATMDLIIKGYNYAYLEMIEVEEEEEIQKHEKTKITEEPQISIPVIIRPNQYRS